MRLRLNATINEKSAHSALKALSVPNVLSRSYVLAQFFSTRHLDRKPTFIMNLHVRRTNYMSHWATRWLTVIAIEFASTLQCLMKMRLY